MRFVRKMVAPTIWIIVVSSVLWSVQGIVTGLSGNAAGVGKVFGKVVTFKEFDDAFKSTQLLTNQPNGTTPSADELQDATWQHIIFNHEAAREKINIRDEDVVAEISKLTGGQMLSAQAYNELIRRNFNEHPRNFEERIRTILKIRKLYERHQSVTSEITNEEVQQFFLNDQNRIAVDYIQLKSEDEAKEFKSRVSELNAWNQEKNKEDKKIGSLGPVNIDIFMTVLGISQTDVNVLLALTPNELSPIVKTKTGYALFNVTQKEMAPNQPLDENKKEDYRNRLMEQKRQTAFYNWMNDVTKRANVEKFKTER